MRSWTAALFLGLAWAGPAPPLHTAPTHPPPTLHLDNVTDGLWNLAGADEGLHLDNVTDLLLDLAGADEGPGEDNGTAAAVGSEKENKTARNETGYLLGSGGGDVALGGGGGTVTTGQQTGTIVVGVFLLVAVVATMGIAIHQNRRQPPLGQSGGPPPNAHPLGPLGPCARRPLPTVPRPLLRRHTAPFQAPRFSDPGQSSWTDVSIPPNTDTRLTRTAKANDSAAEESEDVIWSAFPEEAHPLLVRGEEEDDVTMTTYGPTPTPSVHTALTSSPCSSPATARLLTSAGSPSTGYPVLPSRSSAQWDEDSSSDFLWEWSSASLPTLTSHSPARRPPTPSSAGHTPAAHLGIRAPHPTPSTAPKPALSIHDLWPARNESQA